MSETRSIGKQLADAIVAAIVAAPDLPNVLEDRSWEISPEEVAAMGNLGAIVLAGAGSSPTPGQQKDDPRDDRAGALHFVIWATTRARADAISARIQQLACRMAPIGEQDPFFRLAKRIRLGAESSQTVASGQALAELQLIPDWQQVVTDPTRWK